MKVYSAYYIGLKSAQEIFDVKFQPNLFYEPHIFLEIESKLDSEKLIATIGNKDGYLTPSGIRNFEYYNDYIRGSLGAFTFDRKIYYITKEFRFTQDSKVEVLLEKIKEVEVIESKEEEESKIKKMRSRRQPSAKIKALLQKEINSTCPFCTNEDVDHFEIHHIDSNHQNNNFENLLLLCPLCHSKITKGDITTEQVQALKKSLSNKEKLKNNNLPNSIKIKGNISNSVIANTITAEQIIYKGRGKPKTVPHPDSIEANIEMKSYVKHLIDRYQEFIKDDIYKGEKRFAQIWGAVKKEFGIDAYKISQKKFSDLVNYLQKRIENTRIGRINKSRGQSLYSSFDEYKRKYLQ